MTSAFQALAEALHRDGAFVHVFVTIAIFVGTLFVLNSSSVHRLWAKLIQRRIKWNNSDEGFRVKSLHIYPLKSCAGIELEAAEVDSRGFLFDRRWLIVDDRGHFLTQRQIPQLALIKPTLLDRKGSSVSTRLTSSSDIGSIRLSRQSVDPLQPFPHVDIPIVQTSNADPLCDSLKLDSQDAKYSDPREGMRITVHVWGNAIEGAVDQGPIAAAWLQNVLNREDLRLVYMDDLCIRGFNPDNKYNATEKPGNTTLRAKETSFADATPFMVLSKASVDDLNARIAAGNESSFFPLPMNRFRPNIVVDGTSDRPYDEDTWSVCSVGLVRLHAYARCTRCIITTTDQATATQGGFAAEPLATLRSYRSVKNKKNAVCLGMRMVHETHDHTHDDKTARKYRIIRRDDPIIVHSRADIGPL